MAVDALEEAREISPGAPRNEALKKAGFLCRTADNQGLISLAPEAMTLLKPPPSLKRSARN
jgi:hypothetical protein